MDEKVENFIRDLVSIKDYWIKAGEEKNLDTNEICEGMIHSILVYFDGCSSLNDFNSITLKTEGTKAPINNKGIEMHDFLYPIIEKIKEENNNGKSLLN